MNEYFNITKPTNLVALGCSLTEGLQSWPSYIANRYNLQLVNLALGAGSNTTQVNRIHDYILTQPITDSLVIWQITYFHRYGYRYPVYYRAEDLPEVLSKEEFSTYSSPFPNYFDNTYHLDVANYYCHDQTQANTFLHMSELFCTILLVKHIFKNVLVFFADNTEMIPFNNVYSLIEEFFHKHQIDYVSLDHALNPWCLKNLMPMDETRHPTIETYNKYAEEFLIPKVDKYFI